jgi:hypothetical protein
MDLATLFRDSRWLGPSSPAGSHRVSAVAWVEGCQQREIERLHDEGCRLKEALLELDGGEPIRLSPEQRRLLAEKAKGIDPEVLKQIIVFEFEGFDPECPNDTSAESP